MTLDDLLLIFLWIGVLIGLSRLVDRLLLRTLPIGIYRSIIAPGVAVHELSHAVGCIITGARVIEVKLFSANGGFVKHTKSKVPVVGPVIISLAPLFGGVLVIYAIAWLMNYAGIGALDARHPTTALFAMWHFVAGNALKWHFWVFMYLMISVAASLGPSDQDLKNSAIALFVLALLVSAMILASKWLADGLDVLARPLLQGLSLALFLLVLSLIVIGPFYLLRRHLL